MKLYQMKTTTDKEIPVITLNSTGLAELKEKLENKQNELVKLQVEKKQNLSHTESDWHGSGIYEEDVTMIQYEIERLKNMIAKANIIENSATADANIVDIGDVIEVNLIYSEDDQEKMLIRLGTEHQTKAEDGIEVISINSELGKVLYNAEVGTTVKFGDKKAFSAEILNKINEDIKEKKEEKTKQFSKK